MLNDLQRAALMRPLNEVRVSKRDGMSYLESWDVIAHLGRIFGPDGWDCAVTGYALIFEDFVTWTPANAKTEKKGWDVAYTASVLLTVRDPQGNVVATREDVATGSATHQPVRADAHDLALKSAQSDALKRAARTLGNQFGLSLYDKGSVRSVLGKTLAWELPDPSAAPEEKKAAIEAVEDDGQMTFSEVNGEMLPDGYALDATRTNANRETVATEKQIRFCESLFKKAGIEGDEIERYVEEFCPSWPGSIRAISVRQAQVIIEALKA